MTIFIPDLAGRKFEKGSDRIKVVELFSKVALPPFEDVMMEIWKRIPEWDNYEASNLGRIRSWKGAHGFRKKPKILSQICNSVYMKVSLSNNGKIKIFMVHRLVLFSFVGERPKNMVACHNDGNSKNNKLLNLRWDTHESNQKDKIKHGTYLYGETVFGSKLKTKNIIEIRKLYNMGVKTMSLAEKFGVSQRHIYGVINKRVWRHV